MRYADRAENDRIRDFCDRSVARLFGHEFAGPNDTIDTPTSVQLQGDAAAIATFVINRENGQKKRYNVHMWSHEGKDHFLVSETQDSPVDGEWKRFRDGYYPFHWISTHTVDPNYFSAPFLPPNERMAGLVEELDEAVQKYVASRMKKQYEKGWITDGELAAMRQHIVLVALSIVD